MTEEKITYQDVQKILDDGLLGMIIVGRGALTIPNVWRGVDCIVFRCYHAACEHDTKLTELIDGLPSATSVVVERWICGQRVQSNVYNKIQGLADRYYYSATNLSPVIYDPWNDSIFEDCSEAVSVKPAKQK